MTKEERDKREAEKRARMEGSPDLGGVTLPFSRNALLRIFWIFTLFYPTYVLWSARQDLTFELFLSGAILYVACVLPFWFWCTGRIQGLPIFPIFAISFLPKYVVPVWQGHSLLKQYTVTEVATASWTMAGFLFIAQLFWQQMAVRAVGVPQAVRMINLKKAENVLLWCVFSEVLFEVLSIFLWQISGGSFAAIRGFATAAGRMGIFVFAYQMGQGELSKLKRGIFLILFGTIVVQETASLVLATVLPTVGIAFAAYMLGSGRIPWKALSVTVAAITVLHAGKFEMRALYHSGEKTASFTDYPAYFLEWVGYGLKNLGGEKPGEERAEVSSVKERGSLIHLMVMIQTMTPSKVPYLETQCYDFIPAQLVPRILSPGKKWAHTGNMILSLHYGILSEEGIWRTSVGFDPVMEAYASYGYLGVLALAIVTGFFLGWTTKLTIHVPMLSFGFLFGVLIIGTLVGSWNTMGVFVTSTWQSFLALAGLSLVLMSRENNPVWKYYAIKLAEKLKFKNDVKLKKTLDEVKIVLAKGQAVEGETVTGRVGTEDGGQRAEAGRSPSTQGLGGREAPVAGPTSLQASQTREELRRVEDEAAPQRHERPKRFVYGQKK